MRWHLKYDLLIDQGVAGMMAATNDNKLRCFAQQ
jgi:hypothetical protein